MIDHEKQNAEKENLEIKEFVEFIKDNRKKLALHNFIGIAAKSYLDGMQAALKCQQAAKSQS